MSTTLENYSLSIIEATLDAHVNYSHPSLISGQPKTELIWSINVEANYDFEFEGDAYFERFSFSYRSCPIRERDWKRLTGQIIEWNHPDVTPGDDLEPTFSHDDSLNVIHSGTIRFLERDGCQLRIIWEGLIGGYRPFSIDTWLRFAGVAISNEVTKSHEARDVLAQFLEVDDFIQEPPINDFQFHISYRPRC